MEYRKFANTYRALEQKIKKSKQQIRAAVKKYRDSKKSLSKVKRSSSP